MVGLFCLVCGRQDEQGGGDDKARSTFKRVGHVLCFWDCSSHWTRFSELCSFFVLDAYAELFFFTCAVVNAAFMAADHYHDGR